MVGRSIASFSIVQIPRILLGSSACASDVTNSSDGGTSPLIDLAARTVANGAPWQNRAWAFMVSH
jgi:hypothetical protein